MRFNQIYSILLFVFLLKCPFMGGYGQSVRPFSIKISTQAGQIIKHTPKIVFEIPPLSYGLKIEANWQLYGKKQWHEWRGFPTAGLSFLYYHFGDDVVLGQAYGLYPHLDLYFLNKEKWRGSVRIGGGVAYLTRPYDALDNPTNITIGSHWNCVVEAGVMLQKQWSERLTTEGGLSFTHFSNGNSAVPNLGNNISSVSVGIGWALSPSVPKRFHYLSKKSAQKWGGSLRIEAGLVEYDVPRGPKYPVYIVSAAIMRHLNKVNRLYFGVEYEMNQAVKTFVQHIGLALTDAEAQHLAERWSVYAADELLFGNVGLYAQTGVYLNKNNQYRPKTWYNKIGLRYYAPPFGKPQTRLFGGIYIKAHYANAAYFALGGGAVF